MVAESNRNWTPPPSRATTQMAQVDLSETLSPFHWLVESWISNLITDVKSHQISRMVPSLHNYHVHSDAAIQALDCSIHLDR